MNVKVCFLTLVPAAFAAGLCVGRLTGPSEVLSPDSTTVVRVKEDPTCPLAVRVSDSLAKSSSFAQDGDSPAKETAVVVTEPEDLAEPTRTAEHERRAARRSLARQAQAHAAEDFLLSVDTELMTAEQRERHGSYLEFRRRVCDLQTKISAFRAAGEGVPPELQVEFDLIRRSLLVEEAAEVRTLREAAIRAQGLDEVRLSALLDDFDLIEKSLSSALGDRIYLNGQARGEETSGLGDPRENVR